MEGRHQGLEPLDRAHDLSPLSGEVEAVGRGDRSVQQCHQEGFEVTVFEPASRLEVQGYALEPAAGGTKLTNAVELRASGLLSIVAPLATSRAERAVAANLDTLRQILERDTQRGSG